MFVKRINLLFVLFMAVHIFTATTSSAACTPSLVYILSPAVSETSTSLANVGFAMFTDTTYAAKTVSATLDGTPIGSLDCSIGSNTCNYDFPLTTTGGAHTIVVTAACSGLTKTGTINFNVVAPLDTTPDLTIEIGRAHV